MRSIIPVLLSSGAVLAACAPTVGSTTHDGPVADNQNDCAVIAAVAREHYRFNTTTNVPPPLWLDGEGSTWAPRCDWARHGISFPRLHDPARQAAPGERVQWVRFKQPRYDGRGATIEAGILHGPLAGMGVDCRVISGVAGWTVGECRSSWVS